jgi:PBP1b-binding outer membrane lipoprotein LpoB
MRRAVISVALILGISIMIMGCQPVAERKPATPQQQNQTNNMQFQDTNNMADRFERLAEQVPGVRDATVAVSAGNINKEKIKAHKNPGSSRGNSRAPRATSSIL